MSQDAIAVCRATSDDGFCSQAIKQRYFALLLLNRSIQAFLSCWSWTGFLEANAARKARRAAHRLVSRLPAAFVLPGGADLLRARRRAPAATLKRRRMFSEAHPEPSSVGAQMRLRATLWTVEAPSAVLQAR